MSTEVMHAYFTVNQFCDKHRFIAIGGLRQQIFNEHKNGLTGSGAIIRNGRRVLINEPKYFEWLEAQNKQRAA